MIKARSYVRLVKVTGDLSEEFNYYIGKIFKVEKVIDLEHMKPFKYGIYFKNNGMCYFSDEELELIH